MKNLTKRWKLSSCRQVCSGQRVKRGWKSPAFPKYISLTRFCYEVEAKKWIVTSSFLCEKVGGTQQADHQSLQENMQQIWGPNGICIKETISIAYKGRDMGEMTAIKHFSATGCPGRDLAGHYVLVHIEQSL